MKSMLKTSKKSSKNINTEESNITKEQTLTNSMHIDVLVCIINNPGIVAAKIIKKTKIPPASVYRSLFSLTESGFLNTMNKKPGWKGGNSTIMYASKSQQFQIKVDSKGVRVY